MTNPIPKVFNAVGGRSTGVVIGIVLIAAFLSWFDRLTWEFVTLGSALGGGAKIRAMWQDKYGKGTGTE